MVDSSGRSELSNSLAFLTGTVGLYCCVFLIVVIVRRGKLGAKERKYCLPGLYCGTVLALAYLLYSLMALFGSSSPYLLLEAPIIFLAVSIIIMAVRYIRMLGPQEKG